MPPKLAFPVLFLLTIAALLTALPEAQAESFRYTCLRNWYVDPAGSDDNDGTAPDRAFATINFAANNLALQAGDCVQVAPGTYHEDVGIYRGGSSHSQTGYVAFVSTVRHEAKIVAPPTAAYRAISIGADFVIVDGFDVSQASTANHGPCIDNILADKISHHTVAINNVLHDCGGSGVAFGHGDYYWIMGNEIFRNGSTSGFQTSGISIYQPAAIVDSAPGYHIVVDGNIVHDNAITFPCTDPGWQQCHTDGNGIIIDDLRHTQSPGEPYPFATLVSNNVVYLNGGKGIQIYLSDNVTVLNNTAFNNNHDVLNGTEWRGEINIQDASNNTIMNNIAYAVPAADPGDPRFHNTALSDGSCCGYVAQNNTYRNNLTFSGRPGEASAALQEDSRHHISFGETNLLGQDPRFVSTTAPFDLHLRPDSPAIGAADPSLYPPLDAEGRPRTPPVDLGAYRAASG